MNNDILIKMCETLDQLIENSKTLKKISLASSYKLEVQALHKTQESLLANLIHIDKFLKYKTKPIQNQKTYNSINDKLEKLGNLNISLINKIRKKNFNKSKKLRTHKKKKISLWVRNNFTTHKLI